LAGSGEIFCIEIYRYKFGIISFSFLTVGFCILNLSHFSEGGIEYEETGDSYCGRSFWNFRFRTTARYGNPAQQD